MGKPLERIAIAVIIASALHAGVADLYVQLSDEKISTHR